MVCGCQVILLNEDVMSSNKTLPQLIEALKTNGDIKISFRISAAAATLRVRLHWWVYIVPGKKPLYT